MQKIAGARLRARFAEAHTEVLTDGDGYFSVEMELRAPVRGPLWQRVEFELLEATGYDGPPVHASGQVLMHPLQAASAIDAVRQDRRKDGG